MTTTRFFLQKRRKTKELPNLNPWKNESPVFANKIVALSLSKLMRETFRDYDWRIIAEHKTFEPLEFI